jgi:hypothetical protein
LPILTPEIKKVLKSVGLNQDKPEGSSLEDSAGLSLESTLNTVSHIMDHGDTDTIRLNAANTALKLRGLMKDAGATVPSVTIVIRDSGAPLVNPILIPRAAATAEQETIQ